MGQREKTNLEFSRREIPRKNMKSWWKWDRKKKWDRENVIERGNPIEKMGIKEVIGWRKYSRGKMGR